MNIIKSSRIALVVCLFSNLACAAVWTASVDERNGLPVFLFGRPGSSSVQGFRRRSRIRTARSP